MHKSIRSIRWVSSACQTARQTPMNTSGCHSLPSFYFRHTPPPPYCLAPSLNRHIFTLISPENSDAPTPPDANANIILDYHHRASFYIHECPEVRLTTIVGKLPKEGMMMGLVKGGRDDWIAHEEYVICVALLQWCEFMMMFAVAGVKVSEEQNWQQSWGAWKVRLGNKLAAEGMLTQKDKILLHTESRCSWYVLCRCVCMCVNSLLSGCLMSEKLWLWLQYGMQIFELMCWQLIVVLCAAC